MTHPSNQELADLHRVVEEIFETMGARGHRIDAALDTDLSFRHGRAPQSVLTRALVVDGLRRGASRAGVYCDSGPGGAQELHMMNGNVEHIFRLRRALREEDGSYLIEVNDNSMLRDLEVGMLVTQDRWVLGYTLADYGVGEIFVAPVLGVIEGKPGRLVLGRVIDLGDHATPPTYGFPPADEDLEGFEDDSADEDPGSLPSSG